MHFYYSDISGPLAQELQMAFVLQATESLQDGARGRKEQLKDAVLKYQIVFLQGWNDSLPRQQSRKSCQLGHPTLQ